MDPPLFVYPLTISITFAFLPVGSLYKAPTRFEYTFFNGDVFLFILDKYLGAILLGHVVSI